MLRTQGDERKGTGGAESPAPITIPRGCVTGIGEGVQNGSPAAGLRGAAIGAA